MAVREREIMGTGIDLLRFYRNMALSRALDDEEIVRVAAARSLTWKFYSTSDGRDVEWHTTGLRNRVDPPEPLYTENANLAEGEIKQVDWAVEGADVTVTRVVYRNGEAYLEDAFHTHYVPWRAVYEYGPGTEGIPTPESEEGDPEADPVG